jgi:hypothetical protein
MMLKKLHTMVLPFRPQFHAVGARQGLIESPRATQKSSRHRGACTPPGAVSRVRPGGLRRRNRAMHTLILLPSRMLVFLERRRGDRRGEGVTRGAEG